jgi:hypothetical protein
LLGEVIGCVVLQLSGWQPSLRFLEAALALSAAYLAFEVLALPKAGLRWTVVAVVGGFQGAFLALLLQAGLAAPGVVIASATGIELSIVAVFALLFAAVRKWGAPLRPVPVFASLVMIAGVVSFYLRMRGR